MRTFVFLCHLCDKLELLHVEVKREELPTPCLISVPHIQSPYEYRLCTRFQYRIQTPYLTSVPRAHKHHTPAQQCEIKIQQHTWLEQAVLGLWCSVFDSGRTISIAFWHFSYFWSRTTWYRTAHSVLPRSRELVPHRDEGGYRRHLLGGYKGHFPVSPLYVPYIGNIAQYLVGIADLGKEFFVDEHLNRRAQRVHLQAHTNPFQYSSRRLAQYLTPPFKTTRSAPRSFFSFSH